MITTQLLRPESIVVVGASNNVHKPGGAILKNLINGGYRGELRAVNPKPKTYPIPIWRFLPFRRRCVRMW